MLLSEVRYARPATLEQALGVLAENPGARALAGGQTLLNVMKARAAAPDILVDLSKISELKGIGLGATFTVVGQDGEREVAAQDFFLGVYMTAAGPGELLTKITVPAGRSDGFASVPIGVDGTCIVNAAASVNGGVRVALGCVAATPVLVEAPSADPEAVRSAVREAALEPPSDVHASADYRRHLSEVVAARAVEQAGKGS